MLLLPIFYILFLWLISLVLVASESEDHWENRLEEEKSYAKAETVSKCFAAYTPYKHCRTGSGISSPALRPLKKSSSSRSCRRYNRSAAELNRFPGSLRSRLHLLTLSYLFPCVIHFSSFADRFRICPPYLKAGSVSGLRHLCGSVIFSVSYGWVQNGHCSFFSEQFSHLF